MKLVTTVEAEGHILCHDLTQIIKDVSKEVRFKKGHVVKKEDIPELLSMGKEHLYIWEQMDGFLHENEAAEILFEITAGDSPNMEPAPVKEGKIDVFAKEDGLLVVDTEKLRTMNSLGELMIASRSTYYPIKKGEKLAGTRIIPLTIPQEKMNYARRIAGDRPILSLHPYRAKTVGIITTGSEVVKGLIEDTFTPVIRGKVEGYGAVVKRQKLVGDDPKDITQEINNMLEEGLDFILCTGGMSVDPDDKTPLAIKNSGAYVVSYGAPVLPGAMFLLAYKGNQTIVGLPGCVMYSKRTVFDLVLPRIMADIPITSGDLAGLGNGGLCLNCEVCTYPNCTFGKGI